MLKACHFPGGRKGDDYGDGDGDGDGKAFSRRRLVALSDLSNALGNEGKMGWGPEQLEDIECHHEYFPIA